ncbi:MAG: CoA transferase subunit A [Defluviitaleaceae bacterium]|nr:CoA transferase subunit A [Defluviitaleaceae bacterium]
MSKMITAQAAAEHIKDGMTLFIGGFMTVGTPEALMDAIVARGTGNLTVIANDGGYEAKGIGKLIAAGLVKKLVASHIGLNPLAGKKMNDGSMEVELVPQGTLVEQIRAGGAGLGGVLTPTGLGTAVADGKEVLTIDGKEFLLEKPIRADVALLLGSVVDKEGNIFYKGTTRNFNPIIATAADIVIVEARELVEVDGITPETVMTPGIFVDYIVGGDA